MSNSFEAVYENGVFRPLQPLPLTDGLRVSLTLGPPSGPLTAEQVQAVIRMGQAVFEGFTPEETKDLEADILGERGRNQAREGPRS
jgi:predicted DNA-binding antitoxin AbrB/MazE fold protein